MFFVVSGQLRCAQSKSDVCQLVIVEHFFYGMKSKMAARKYDFSLKASKLLQIDPMYVWNMNINLGIVVVLMSMPSPWLVYFLRYGLFIVFDHPRCVVYYVGRVCMSVIGRNV